MGPMPDAKVPRYPESWFLALRAAAKACGCATLVAVHDLWLAIR